MQKFNFWLVFLALFVLPLAFFASPSLSQVTNRDQTTHEFVVQRHIVKKQSTFIEMIQKKKMYAFVVAKMFGKKGSLAKRDLSSGDAKLIFGSIRILVESFVSAHANLDRIRHLETNVDENGMSIESEKVDFLGNSNDLKILLVSTSVEVFKKIIAFFLNLLVEKAKTTSVGTELACLVSEELCKLQ